jgi:hypothetical protein
LENSRRHPERRHLIFPVVDLADRDLELVLRHRGRHQQRQRQNQRADLGETFERFHGVTSLWHVHGGL